MTDRQEKLDGLGKVKATMLKAHLDWLEPRVPAAIQKLDAKVEEECRAVLKTSLLAWEWVPFRCFVRLDQAIAELAGGPLETTLREMGRYSASVNLGGVYQVFVVEEPHRFFTRMTVLHRQFQSFGNPVYEKTGDRSGKIKLEGCQEYSPVYCASALGYYEGALEMMQVPGPIRLTEVTCQCAGDAACLYQLSW